MKALYLCIVVSFSLLGHLMAMPFNVTISGGINSYPETITTVHHPIISYGEVVRNYRILELYNRNLFAVEAYCNCFKKVQPFLSLNYSYTLISNYNYKATGLTFSMGISKTFTVKRAKILFLVGPAYDFEKTVTSDTLYGTIKYVNNKIAFISGININLPVYKTLSASLGYKNIYKNVSDTTWWGDQELADGHNEYFYTTSKYRHLLNLGLNIRF
jgi:hypothetical protein